MSTPDIMETHFAQGECFRAAAEAKKNLGRPTADDAGLYYEARVSEALGVPRKMLARLRGSLLTEGPHFVRREANAVALTALGLAMIDAALRSGDAGKPGFLAGKPASGGKSYVPAGPPPREVMTIERVPQNTGILLCQRKNPASTVAVRVKTNENFSAGMQIQCVAGNGIWQFCNRAPGGKPGDESTCGRLPRQKGRW